MKIKTKIPRPLMRRQLRRPRRKRTPRRPTIRFSPTAWAKLLYLRDAGPTEVGGFGITDPEDLLCVQDVQLVKQHCTETFVSFEDVAVAEFFEDQVDQGHQPEQFGRIWIHTHPGSSPEPSTVDEETFQRVFGHCDWAVMFILARGGSTYARLHWRTGGPAQLQMNVEVDFAQPFVGSDQTAWQQLYQELVTNEAWQLDRDHTRTKSSRFQDRELDLEYADLFGEFPQV